MSKGKITLDINGFREIKALLEANAILKEQMVQIRDTAWMDIKDKPNIEDCIEKLNKIQTIADMHIYDELPYWEEL